MDFLILGSGSIGATSMSASTLVDNKILVDVPNGIIKQIKRQGVLVSNIETVFVTHLHGDHFFDLPFLLFEKYFLQDTKKLTIYGPKGIQDAVTQLFEIGFPDTLPKIEATYPIEWIEFSKSVTFSFSEYIAFIKKVDHGDFKPAFGLILEKGDSRIGFSGDSLLCPSIYEIVEGSNTSILDMSFVKENTAHMTLDDILMLCQKYPNKKMIATHMQDFTKETAKKLNISNLIIPDDGDCFQV